MFKLPRKRTSLSAAGVKSSSTSPHPDCPYLVRRIIDGDAAAEAELVEHFQGPVLHIIRRTSNNSSLVEDFSQDTFLTVIRKIRNGDVQQPESLGAFIANVARYHTIEMMRGARRRVVIEDLGTAEQLPDPSPNSVERLQQSEQFDEIRDLIQQLNPRDRELIWRFYISEEPKAHICAGLGLTSVQFDRVLHRARKRYKALYFKRKGLAEQRTR